MLKKYGIMRVATKVACIQSQHFSPKTHSYGLNWVSQNLYVEALASSVTI